ncbi:MAG: type II toxin-antitoxin system RelE/ParE family toxin [Chloroflexota bacterium]
MYRYTFSPRADREIRILTSRAPRRDVERLLQAIDNLGNEPSPYGVMKLKGSNEGYRIRAGDYRILYEIYDKSQTVTITRVLRRNEGTYRA